MSGADRPIASQAVFALYRGIGLLPMPKSFFTRRYKIFREQLRDARTSAGLSQEDLAKKMGWDQTYVSKIERGVLRVDVVELIAICEVLGIDPSQFVAELQRHTGGRRLTH